MKGGLAVIDRLKEYKELIAIVVFFLGGFFWLETHFPSKSDLKGQIDVLHCLLDKYMTLTQLEIHVKDLGDKATALGAELNSFPEPSSTEYANLSPAMKQMRADKEAQLKDAQDQLKKAQTDVQTTNDELTRNVCGSPKT